MGSILRIHITCPLKEATSLTELWNTLLKPQPECKPRDNTLRGWSSAHRMSIYALHQQPNMWDYHCCGGCTDPETAGWR